MRPNNESKLKVLIADDSPTVLDVTRHYIKEAFSNVDIAMVKNGEAAKEFFIKTTYCDLIVCDWEMPKVSGAEFLEWIRTNPKLNTIPFIMISNHKKLSYIEKAISLGVNGYLMKPFTIQGLVTKILSVSPRFNTRVIE
jgi:CheY-like chemotaxis protein